LYKVTDPAARRFIDRCLAPASRRPTAVELLSDPFLKVEDDGFCIGEEGGDYSAMYDYLHQPACLDHHHHHAGGSNGSSASNGASNGGGRGGGGDYGDRWDYSEDDDDGSLLRGIDQLFNENEDEHVAGVDITIKGKRMEDGSIFLRLRIADKDGTGRVRNIYFPFDADADTALSVATEMVAELDITDHEVTHIAEMIDGEVGALLPHWTPGPGMDDDDDAPPDASNAPCCKNCRYSAASSGGGSSSSSLDDYMSAAARRGCRCAEMHGRFEEITFQADEEQVQFQSSGCSSDDGGGQADDGKKLMGINGAAQGDATECSDQP